MHTHAHTDDRSHVSETQWGTSRVSNSMPLQQQQQQQQQLPAGGAENGSSHQQHQQQLLLLGEASSPEMSDEQVCDMSDVLVSILISRGGWRE